MLAATNAEERVVVVVDGGPLPPHPHAVSSPVAILAGRCRLLGLQMAAVGRRECPGGGLVDLVVTVMVVERGWMGSKLVGGITLATVDHGDADQQQQNHHDNRAPAS